MSVWRENPTAELRFDADGRWWQELPQDDKWVHLGFSPAPQTAWQTFWHHVYHGLLMHYALLAVLAFAWRQRHSFRDEGGLQPHIEQSWEVEYVECG